jgi:[ribosomal protein S18]-alanine N-acetyltransferase
MTLLRSFFSKPGFYVEAIGAERGDECAKLHGASFAFGWSKIDFESYLADRHVIADGALSELGIGRRPALWGMILSRLMPPDAEILTFAVDPARRGGGVGRVLLDRHLMNLERGGARLVFLEVGDDNAAALALYEREGFKIIGRRENYYLRANGERHAAVTMRLEL